MLVDEDLFARWVKQLRERQQTRADYDPKGAKDLFGKRYLHFDLAATEAELTRWQPILLDPNQVRQRAFYPFLQLEKRPKRYQRDELGVRRPAPPKPRELCYAAHHDALFYSWYGFQLEERLDKQLWAGGLTSCVLAYRSLGRNNVQFAKEVFDYIAGQPACVALAFDVTKFFPSLDHYLLKQAWAELLGERELPPDHYTLFKAVTKYRFIPATQVKAVLGEEAFKRSRPRGRLVYPRQFRRQLLAWQQTHDQSHGIPQGAPLSAVLSNLYMRQADAVLHQFAQASGGLYRRYCDDLLLIVPAGAAVAAEAVVREQMAALRLELNEGKTERRTFARDPAGQLGCHDEHGQPRPLQYLGLEFDGATIRLRPASLARYHQRLRRAARRAVRHAWQAGGHGTQVYCRRLYDRFTHLGQANFITYAERAAAITGSAAIRQQVRGSVARVKAVVRDEQQRQATRYPDGVVGGAGHRRVGF